MRDQASFSETSFQQLERKKRAKLGAAVVALLSSVLSVGGMFAPTPEVVYQLLPPQIDRAGFDLFLYWGNGVCAVLMLWGAGALHRQARQAGNEANTLKGEARNV